MRKRMTIALLALTGLFISVYLLLYTLGFYGELVCGSGSCETVQTSEYASLFGIPVAGWGAAWYGAVLVLSFLAVQPAFAEAKWTTPSILLLAGLGLLFSIYLTYVELFVIYAICWWCVTSAVLTLLIFLLALPLGGRRPADAGEP